VCIVDILAEVVSEVVGALPAWVACSSGAQMCTVNVRLFTMSCGVMYSRVFVVFTKHHFGS
jgi:hypothetical protein